jgi:hypothetical protein
MGEAGTGAQHAVPENVEELCARVAEVPGAQLARLLSRLTQTGRLSSSGCRS